MSSETDAAIGRLAEQIVLMLFGYDNDEMFEGHRSSTRQSTIESVAAELAGVARLVEAAWLTTQPSPFSISTDVLRDHLERIDGLRAALAAILADDSSSKEKG